MNVNREKKKEEAISRMKMLGIFDHTIKEFKDKGIISVSEPPFGAFFWANEEEAQEIQKFEDEYNALVYVVVRSFTDLGVMDSYLYVSDHEEEWERDREDIKENTQFAYVINRSDPDCSEFGYIGLKRSIGAGLLRIW